MGFYNKKHIEAFHTNEYFCDKCESLMQFEDEWEETLICPKCGRSMDSDRYRFESDEEYEALFPTKEELEEIENDDKDENDYGECYDRNIDE